MKIGIPQQLYYYTNIFEYFFEQLNIETVKSINTNKEIIKKGNLVCSDEECISMKIILGHIDYLKDKCDYILIPHINNYGRDNQTCSNYLCLYDLVKNMITDKIIPFEINYLNNKNELNAFYEIGKILNIQKKKIKKAYYIAQIKNKKYLKKLIINNYNKLNSSKLKILIISHPYLIMDEYFKSIKETIENLNCTIIYGHLFDSEITNKLSYKLSNTIYFKYSKELIGSIVLTQHKIDAIIFISSFPCGLDSLVNELVMRKINIPYINLVIDDSDSIEGIKTRIESLVDIIE